MKRTFGLRNFRRLTNGKLLEKALRVEKGLTDNPDYPTLQPKLPALNTGIQQFSVALSLAKNGGKIKINEKDKQSDALKVVLMDLLEDVNYIAKGDENKILRAGYDVNGKTVATIVMEEVKNFNAKQGRNSGEVVLKTGRVPGAVIYQYEWTETPAQEGSWKVQAVKTLKQVIKNLTRGKEYSFRVGAKDSNGYVIYSAVVTLMVV